MSSCALGSFTFKKVISLGIGFFTVQIFCISLVQVILLGYFSLEDIESFKGYLVQTLHLDPSLCSAVVKY